MASRSPFSASNITKITAKIWNQKLVQKPYILFHILLCVSILCCRSFVVLVMVLEDWSVSDVGGVGKVVGVGDDTKFMGKFYYGHRSGHNHRTWSGMIARLQHLIRACRSSEACLLNQETVAQKLFFGATGTYHINIQCDRNSGRTTWSQQDKTFVIFTIGHRNFSHSQTQIFSPNYHCLSNQTQLFSLFPFIKPNAALPS